MALVRFDPFRDLATLQDRMNRMFEESLRGRGEAEDWALGGAWAPAVDIYEHDGNIVLKAELPGVDPKDVDIRIENNVWITERGCIDLFEGIPITVEEIERHMRRP